MNLRHLRTAALWALPLALAALATGCGESPTAPSTLTLATVHLTYNVGTAAEPTQPLTAHVSFGVQSNPPDYSHGDYPYPLILGDHALTYVGQTVRAPMTGGNAVIVAGRLSDGVDESTFWQVAVDGSGNIGTGSKESTTFDYSKSHDFMGPDFVGYAVTAIELHMTALSMERHSDGLYYVTCDVTATVLGQKT